MNHLAFKELLIEDNWNLQDWLAAIDQNPTTPEDALAFAVTASNVEDRVNKLRSLCRATISFVLGIRNIIHLREQDDARLKIMAERVNGAVANGKIAAADSFAQALMDIQQMVIETYRDALVEFENFHPRATKLIKKKKPFIVVAVDEPYFEQVYTLIKSNEEFKKRWTIGDEAAYHMLINENHARMKANEKG